MRVEELAAPDKIVRGGQPHKMFRFVTAQNRDGAVVIVEKAGKIALARQNRFAINTVSLELPQGMGDKEDKDPIETGMREASEELGIKVKDGKNIGNLFADTAVLANKIHIIVCKYDGYINEGDGELLSVHYKSIKEVKKLLKENKIKDGISMSALLTYLIYKEEI